MASTVAPGARKRRVAADRRSAGDDRWEQILTAAASVFFEKGYEAATVADVAAAAGLLSGSLYYYIVSKEDLLFELTRRVHVDVVGRLADPPLPDGPPAARLDAFIDRWIEHLAANRSWSLLVERELRVLRDDRLEEVLQLRSDVERILRDTIERGIAEGAFDAGTDASVATHTILQLLNHTPQWFRDDGRLSFAAIGAWEREFIHRGLAAAPSDRGGRRAPR